MDARLRQVVISHRRTGGGSQFPFTADQCSCGWFQDSSWTWADHARRELRKAGFTEEDLTRS